MTQTAASGRDAHEPRPRLGEVLVARGVLTDEQLLEALVANQGTGVPLGRFLVQAGYATASAIAMALADQHGGLINTEYGFATGHGTLPPVRRIDFDEAPAVRVVPPPPEPAHAEQISELEAELAEARARIEREAVVIAQLKHDLATANAEIEAAHRMIDELQARAGAAQAQRDEYAHMRDMLAVEQSVTASLRAALEEAEERVTAERAARLAAETAAPPVEAADAGPHVLFFRLGDRYCFSEQEGAAPLVGSTVELEGLPFEVLRLGPAPVPGYTGLCAFLEPR